MPQPKGDLPLERLLARAQEDVHGWTDATSHDPGIALLELFAYLADALSVHADAIANEAYLGSPHDRAKIDVDIDGEPWTRVASLEDAGPEDRSYVIEWEDNGVAMVRFGDGEHGQRPDAGADVGLRYRAGLGRSTFVSVRLQQGRVTIDADWNAGATPPGTAACGVHRGMVVNATDPMAQHRVQVLVPSVLGTQAPWALPCLDPGIPATSPTVGSQIWVMFEACDPDRPIWLGTRT